jgi:hypothetical protein
VYVNGTAVEEDLSDIVLSLVLDIELRAPLVNSAPFFSQPPSHYPPERLAATWPVSFHYMPLHTWPGEFERLAANATDRRVWPPP